MLLLWLRKVSLFSPLMPASRVKAAVRHALSKIRQYEPDIRFAIDYLVTLPYVDENRIGAIGVCGGGGYTIHAAITDHRIKALTSITGVNFGRLIREGFSNFDPISALEKMGAQRTAEAKGAERNVINYLPPSVEQGKKNGITDIDVLEATDYTRRSEARSRTVPPAACSLSTVLLWVGMRSSMPRCFLRSR
jgi:hypothetical protein